MARGMLGGGEYDVSAPFNPAWAQIAQQQKSLEEQQREFNVGQANYQQQLAAQQLAAQQAGQGLSGLVNEYNQAFAEAKSSYEQRYQQMLGIADQTTNQRQADIRTQFAQQAASGVSNLQRLGMANTTLAPTLQQGTKREESSALNRLADQMQQTKLGIIGGHVTSDKAFEPDSTKLQALLGLMGPTGVYGAGQAGQVFGSAGGASAQGGRLSGAAA